LFIQLFWQLRLGRCQPIRWKNHRAWTAAVKLPAMICHICTNICHRKTPEMSVS
jgi:hypothetical protein